LQKGTHRALRPRVGDVAPATAHVAPARADELESHRTRGRDGRHGVWGRQAGPERGGKAACLITIPVTRLVDVPISGKALALMPTIGPPSSASLRVIRATSASGWATTRTRERVIPSSLKPFPLAARSCKPTHGRATGAAIQPMPQSTMEYANGRGMTMVIADEKCMATPVREQVPRSVPTCMPSGVSTSSTCISIWRRTEPWSIGNVSRPS